VASGWQNKLARVSRMDWEEVRVRAGQEIHKRRDLFMHRLGMSAGAIRLGADSAAHRGRFFFADGEASERAELLRTHLPNEAAAILREADEICGHRFRLLGYENLDFALAPDGSNFDDVNYEDVNSKDIDWHLDPVHCKRAPMEPWFRIPFLDFSVVGDHKVTWELNRHQQLVTLAKARLLSGDVKYTRELMAQWHSWIKSNPYPLGINWGSTLEVAFRSLSWIWVDKLLVGAAECAEFRSQLAQALAFHGRYIERYLSTYFSPNTHLLGEAVALFFLGTLYPQMPGAARRKESGWKIVVQEAQRQVRPDGIYFEQSLYYHVYALDFFLYARLLATRNGMEIPEAYDGVLGRMLDVVAALAQAGPAEGFGDDDGGRLFNPRRNRTEQMTDPLAIGAAMYSREFPAVQLTEEAIWLLGNKAIEKLPPNRSSAPSNRELQSLAFPDGGIYVLASSKPFAQVMAVDAGPQGVGRSGHGHADALSVRLTINGQRWLVDSGSGVYISKDLAMRNEFRGTGAHNTLRVDGIDQAVPDEPFSWTNIPTTCVESWITRKTFTYFVGSHNGYERLADPVVHRRHVLRIANDLWLIRDVAIGKAEHELEVRWHFAPDLEVHAAGPGRIETKARATAGQSSSSSSLGLSLIVPQDVVWKTLIEVSKNSISPAYGRLQAAPLARSSARILLPAETATALILHSDAISHADEPRLISTPLSAVQVYELDYHGSSHQVFFALGDKAWSSGPWTSDAQVLYCCLKNEKLIHLVVIGGTQVAWQGQPLLNALGTTKFFEWNKENAAMNASSSEVSITPLFEQLTGETLTTDVNNISSPYAEKH
jgi:hypothetical protein